MNNETGRDAEKQILKEKLERQNQNKINLIFQKGVPEDTIILPEQYAPANVFQLIKKLEKDAIPTGFKRQTLVEMLTVNVKKDPLSLTIPPEEQPKEVAEIKFAVVPKSLEDFSITLTAPSESAVAREQIKAIRGYFGRMGEISKLKEATTDTGMGGDYIYQFNLKPYENFEELNVVSELIKENTLLKRMLLTNTLERLIIAPLNLTDTEKEAIKHLTEDGIVYPKAIKSAPNEISLVDYETRLYEILNKKLIVSRKDICSKTKKRRVSFCRMIAAFLFRMNFAEYNRAKDEYQQLGKKKKNLREGYAKTGYLSFPELGRRMGNKNHATIILYCRKFGRYPKDRRKIFTPTGDPALDYRQVIDVYSKKYPLELEKIMEDAGKAKAEIEKNRTRDRIKTRSGYNP